MTGVNVGKKAPGQAALPHGVEDLEVVLLEVIAADEASLPDQRGGDQGDARQRDLVPQERCHLPGPVTARLFVEVLVARPVLASAVLVRRQDVPGHPLDPT